MDKIYKPDYTPKQMFQLGIFSGMYFRPIFSNITKKNYVNSHKEFDFLKNLDLSKFNNGVWKNDLNMYNIRSGLSLKYWEDHNWIHKQDPYGHVQWYCRYYSGRRTDDDLRQIKRSLKFLIRFGQRKNPSDKVKQALLQWGWNWKKDHTKYIKQIKELI